MTNIDRINKKILQELQKDGRISNTDLAERVGLSPSACLRRVQELERQDIITGYRAVINHAALGVGIVIFVTVGLGRHQKKDQEAFEKAMRAAPEVRECHNITGVVEYLLRIEVADLAAYKKFHMEVLGTVPEVSSITSYIC
ncbi:MAG TPA: Lrp/AsnC family transcriptional regulator, partial [Alphaproteobacteria bacterium]|nr:Lrp/AsnC family transcriptional regulator [Alphaproteobacteria bacterium]